MTQLIKMHRFWDKVSLSHDKEGYKIYLDHQLLRLPKKSILCVSSLTLAQKLVSEWEKAGEKKGDSFSLEALPITRIVSTWIEKIKPNRQQYIDALMPYLNGDLLCYRADCPKELVDRQRLEWDPLIQWVENFFDIHFKITCGVMPIEQDQLTFKKVHSFLINLSDEELTFFVVIVPLLGSLILATAIKEKFITPLKGYDLAYLDEEIQARTWGYDSEQQQRLQRIKQEIIECDEFLCLIKN